VGATRTRQKSQGTPQPLPPHMRIGTARRKAATFNRADRGSPTDNFPSVGADPLIRIRLVPLCAKALCNVPTMLRGPYGSKRPVRTFSQEYLATTATSAMFPTVGPKSIKKPVFSGFESRTETVRMDGSWRFSVVMDRGSFPRRWRSGGSPAPCGFVNPISIVFSGVR
jgi:hypothetical protein